MEQLNNYILIFVAIEISYFHQLFVNFTSKYLFNNSYLSNLPIVTDEIGRYYRISLILTPNHHFNYSALKILGKASLVYEVTIKQSFSAAHILKEIGGTCEKLHGHNFIVEVSLSSSELTEAGILIDFKILKEWTEDILKCLDHKDLNEVDYFKNINPSAENVARFIYDSISEKVKDHNIHAARVTVWESEDARASYSQTFVPFSKV
jgi:6-pyruvoyltetrahydropterin/6-carboxytetrahydropterin synthase